MKKNKLLSNGCLLLAAIVWGFAFVQQEQAAKYVDSFTVNALRSLIAAVALIPLIIFTAKKSDKPIFEKTKKDRNLTIKAGVMCGALLCVSANLQQFGISLYPSDAAISARSGFITALYVILVPVCGIFMKKRVGLPVWLSVVISTVGLYLLCCSDGISGIYKGDLVVLCCALCFSLQILCVDHFIDRVDGIKLAMLQFLTCGILSMILMFVFENPTITNIADGFWYILYLGLISSGCGYTLQIIGQKYSTSPTVSSILMSLESVFAAIGGWIFMRKALSPVEILGCIIMFIAIVLAQLPYEKLKKQ